MIEETKTSAEWKKTLEFRDVDIIDPDGWDRADWEYSWEVERITRTQFLQRLCESTVRWRIITTPVSMGWGCPTCGRVNAPYIRQYECPGFVTITTSTEIKV